MSDRLDVINKEATKLDGFMQALEHVNKAASQRMVDPSKENMAASRKRTGSAPKSILSPPMKMRPTKTIKLPAVVEDALRQAGVAFHQDSVDALRETLAKAQLERHQKLEEQYSAASSSTHEILAEVLGKADADLRAILDALYCNTDYRTVSFSDKSLDERLKKLEAELEDVDHNIMNAESEELSTGEEKVARFIQKWG